MMAGMPKAESMFAAMVLIWDMLPMPKEARVQKAEKRMARRAPIFSKPFLEPRPSRR